MGYTISIGEHEVNEQDDCCSNYVKKVHHDNAPAFGEPTDFTNERWPSYNAWENAMQALGMRHIKFIDKHPGFVKITKGMIDEFDACKKQFEKENPGVTASYETGNLKDGWYCRAVWLEYWLHWAFENCEKPVIVNT